MRPAESIPPAADPFATLASTILLTQLPVAAAALDAAGRGVAWNPAAERLTGLSMDAMSGSTSLTSAAGLMDEDGATPTPEADPVTLALSEGRTREARLLLRRSNGVPIRLEGLPGMSSSMPWRSSNEQFTLTSTCSCGRATSHGSGRRSQLSGRSCCHPFEIDWRKMPYS